MLFRRVRNGFAFHTPYHTTEITRELAEAPDLSMGPVCSTQRGVEMAKLSGFTLFKFLTIAITVAAITAIGGAAAEQLVSPGRDRIRVSLSQPMPDVPSTSTVIYLPIIAKPAQQQPQQEGAQLTLSDTVASPGKPITVTVTNHTTSTLAAYNHESLCSIFTIQRRNENQDGWDNVLECVLETPTVPVAIPPGESRSLTFNGGPHFLDLGALEPGVYRVELSYKLVDELGDIDRDEIPWQTAFSPIFTISP